MLQKLLIFAAIASVVALAGLAMAGELILPAGTCCEGAPSAMR